jgi:YD repeat-containing protein
MGLFQWLAPATVRANRPNVVKNLVVLCILLVGGAANAGWSYLPGWLCKTTVAEVAEQWLDGHNNSSNGWTLYFSVFSINETTGAYGGTYYGVYDSTGAVGPPVAWSAQATSCQVVRPVEVELISQHAGNGNSCQRPPDGFKTPNPIIPATGEKVLDHQDYAGQGPAALSLTRNYRSTRLVGAMTGSATAGLGQTWSHNHATRLEREGTAGSAGSTAKVILASSNIRAFNWEAATNSWKAVDSVDTLAANPAGLLYKRLDDDSGWQFDSTGKLLTITQRNGWTTTYTYSSALTPIGIAPVAGLLISVSNQFGRSLDFTYNATSQLVSVTAPGSQATTYGYDGAADTSRLTTVRYPANTGIGTVSKTYLYENASFPQLVTGVIDEIGNRLATYAYDSQGRATSSQLAQGAELYSVSYPASDGGATTVTDPLGTTRSYNYGIAQGKLAVTGSDKPSGAGNSSAASRIQDINGFVTQETDFLGVNTMYTWDVNRRLPLTTTKAAGLPEAQTSTTQWHSTYRLPVLVTEAGRTTAYAYDGAGNTLSQTVTDTASNVSRAASWTYNPQGLLATETDANGAVARSYAYYATGSFVPLPPPDPFDPDIQSVSVLLHGDGANNSTVMADSAPAAKTVTAVGGAKISTAQSKFGGSMDFDGADDYLSVPANPGINFDFGTGDLTIESWFYLSSAGSGTRNLVVILWGSTYMSLRFADGGFGTRLQFASDASSIASIYSSEHTQASLAGAWHHVAFTRSGGLSRAFLDGNLLTLRNNIFSGAPVTSWADTSNISSVAQAYVSFGGGAVSWLGYLDDLRITKGVARYTASFTPPAMAFPHNGPSTVVGGTNAVGHTAGDLQSITNAAGHVTQFTQYDRAGRVRQMVDPKGVITDTVYTPRGWTSSVTVTPPGGAARTTSYTYDNAGQLTAAALPDGTTLGYSYDAAHRLTGVTDAKGNSITYTLDNMGNKTGEQVKDPSGNLQRNITASMTL